MKAIGLVSGVIFLAILVASVAIVYDMGLPVIEKLQCSARLDQAQDAFLRMDKAIKKVVYEGEGSRRTVELTFTSGKLTFDSERDFIKWEDECGQQVISPRVRVSLGDVYVGSGLDVKAYEGECLGESSYILENKHLKVCFRKIGSPSNMQGIDTKDVLLGMYNKDLNYWMPLKYMEITVDSNSSSSTGVGYTELVEEGYNLPFGEVLLFIDSVYIPYKVRFILESGADFMIIKGE